MKAKINDFLSYIESIVGYPYLWGGQGETLFQQIKKLAKSKGQSEESTNTMLGYMQKHNGIKDVSFFDCSGIAVNYLIEKGILTSDTTAAGLYGKCRPISNAEARPGDWCFLKGEKGIHHIGYVVNDGYAIHAYNQARGVIEDKLTVHNWIYARPEFAFEFESQVAPVQLKPGDKVTIDHPIAGYNTEPDARAKKRQAVTYPAGTYYVYKLSAGATNITRKRVVPEHG